MRTRLLAAGGVTVISIGGGVALADVASSNNGSIAAAVVELSPDGDLVAYCLPDGSIEYHIGNHEEALQLFANPKAAANGWVDDVQRAASSYNPSLAFMSIQEREFWLDRMGAFYGPARELSLEEGAHLDDGSILFEQAMPAEAGPPPAGAMRWLAVQAVVRPHGSEYFLDYVVVCTDAIVERGGQEIPGPAELPDGQE